jgi:adenosylhomocysteine nucleosidase
MGDLTPTLGIVCGMQSELHALGRWARDARVRVAVSGARPAQAETEARRLIDEGCRVLLSWGVAGGLDPTQIPGDLVIPTDAVGVDGRSWALSIGLFGAATAGVPPRAWEVGGRLLGLDRMVLTLMEKIILHEKTGAVAVDMETHRVALVAAEAGLPILAIRAIGDPAGRVLPELVTQALGADGRPRFGPVIAGLLWRPGDLRALVQVKRDTDAALAALAGIADEAVMTILDGL